MLFERAELANFVDDGGEHRLGTEVAVPAESCGEAVLTELFVGVIEGFRDAVGVESQGIAG